jgi:hypothetical protein
VNNLVKRLLVYSAVLALCALIAPAPGLAKEKSRSSPQSGARIIAIKKQAAIDADGYRLVSTDSKMKCMQTLRSTLDCRE